MADTAALSNNPPDPIAGLRARLAESFAPLIAERDELAARAAALPAGIETDEDNGKFADLIVAARKVWQTADASREDTKKPHLDASRVVDEWFKAILSPLAQLGHTLKQRSEAYLLAKARAERAAREKAAREAEEIAQRQRAEAEAASKKALELAAAAPNPSAVAGAIGEAEVAAAAAGIAEGDAAAAAVRAGAGVNVLSRTVSAAGSTASASLVWTGEILDRDTLDLSKLRPYIPLPALQTALNAAVKAGVRSCAGAIIEEKARGNYR